MKLVRSPPSADYERWCGCWTTLATQQAVSRYTPLLTTGVLAPASHRPMLESRGGAARRGGGAAGRAWRGAGAGVGARAGRAHTRGERRPNK